MCLTVEKYWLDLTEIHIAFVSHAMIDVFNINTGCMVKMVMTTLLDLEGGLCTSIVIESVQSN